MARWEWNRQNNTHRQASFTPEHLKYVQQIADAQKMPFSRALRQIIDRDIKHDSHQGRAT